MTLVLNGSDTSAGDDAGLGYTSAEGIIITGQGSTSDVTIKNDADATVISIPTGTTTALMATTSELQFYTSAYGIRASTGLEIKTGDFTRFLKGTTEYMRLDTNGKLGIGTATPASYTSDTLVISSGDQGGMTLVSADNVENYISWADGTSGAAQLQAGYIGYNHSSNYMRFGTVATERMRMLSDGQLIVAGTSFNANGSVCIGPIGTSSNGCTAVSASTSATNIWRFYNPNGQVGGISISGSATTFATSSDYRLKENVNYTFDATTRLKQLKPARFNFKADDTNTLVDGFIAHEVSSVVPEAITGTKDAVDENGDAVYQGIDQSKLVPLLVKTIQEQQTVIEALETRITALEAG
tara:strand:- start:161 stop:1225 length:1065 start_codon:yes stop_codon:yes gene_type:complete